MSGNTPGEITESRIDEVSLVFQGADQDSELVVLTKSVIEDPAVCPDCGNNPCTCDSEEGESEDGMEMDKGCKAKKACGTEVDKACSTDKACGSVPEQKSCVKKAYEDLIAVDPSEWPEEIQKGLTDAVLSLYSEDQEIEKSADGRIEIIEESVNKIHESIAPFSERLAAIEEQLKKAATVEPVVSISDIATTLQRAWTDDEILAKACEIQAARKQADKPAVVQKSVNPRLLEQVDTLRRSVEKLSNTVSREMGISVNH